MKDLLKHLWDLQRDTTRLLETMVNMDSPSSDKALVDTFGRFIGSEFEAIGGNVEHIAAGRFGNHVLVRFPGPDNVRPVLLLGHTDTVFSAGEAARRPFRIQEGKATGPGVFDMKAGIAVMWAALKVMKSMAPLPRPVTVLLNSDEEVGSPSSRPVIENEAQAVKAALVLEPSLPGGAVKTSRKGTGQFTIKAIGRAAHTGIDPERGINAIAEIALQVQELHKLSSPSAGTTVTVSVIQGGTRVNVVPAEAGLEADIRVSSHEEAARIIEAIRSLKAQLPGASLQIRGGINRPPMERSSDIAGLFVLAKEITSEMGLNLEEGSTGGASDGNFTSAMGVPTLDGLGPIGRGAHSLDEYVEIDSIPPRAALLAELIRRV
jgi:glutamate carboxypeptidase